jgi:hypothetical protein
MSKRFWAIIAVIALILIGVVWATDKKNNTNTTTQPTNHVEGTSSTGVSLVEYGDYQCPYCGQYYGNK